MSEEHGAKTGISSDCHSERNLFLHASGGKAQSRNLLFCAAKKQVSRPHGIIRKRTIPLRSK
jgi:hypothetical protein